MTKSIEQRIQELEDRDEIKELTARYCWHVAHGEGEAVANLFADDGVLDVRDADFKAVRGREALLKFYRASVREPEVAIPFIQNHIIEVNVMRRTAPARSKPASREMARASRLRVTTKTNISASAGDGASSNANYFSITWFRSSRAGPKRKARAGRFSSAVHERGRPI